MEDNDTIDVMVERTSPVPRPFLISRLLFAYFPLQRSAEQAGCSYEQLDKHPPVYRYIFTHFMGFKPDFMIFFPSSDRFSRCLALVLPPSRLQKLVVSLLYYLVSTDPITNFLFFFFFFRALSKGSRAARGGGLVGKPERLGHNSIHFLAECARRNAFVS